MLRLRPYKSADAETIVGWLGDERSFYQWCGGRYESYPISAGDMNDYYRATEGLYPMTAVDENGIAGHLTLRYMDQEEKDVRLGFVIVDPGRRGKGCGRELVQLAAKYAITFMGAEKVSLAVFENNTRAYTCYLAAGFQDVTAETSNAYTFKDESWHCRRLEMDGSKAESEGLTGILNLMRRDMVTGMYSQQGILEQMEKWKEVCLESGEKLLLISVDLEKLSNINDIYGHSEGDVAIQTLAELIKDSLSEHEIAARLGGDEFVIVMRIVGDAEQAVDSLIHAINGRLDNYNRLSDKEYSLAINSSYLVLEPNPELRMQEALDNAFTQKRIVKNNRRRAFSAIREVVKERDFDPAEESMVNEILDGNLFNYAFQPIVDARTGDIFGYEALMRAGEDDSVPPYVIMKYAIKCSRLYDVELATFGNVLATVAAEREQFGDKKIFVNSIPGYQLDTADYEKLRREYGDILRQMMVEVIEQSELDDTELEVLLQRSAEAGFGIAIDDYGTGYSNTSSLLRYLPNCLKIDRLLITNIQEEPKKQHFVKSIIGFAHDNGFLALAEGVETAAELKAVIQMGADLIQGFYTARPSAEIIQQLKPEIKSEIVNANIDTTGQPNRKIFMVTEEKELPLMRLALEQYTGILLADQKFTLLGNAGYAAGMTIKIKDGSCCDLTLRNVHLESVAGLPCIDIGENVRLTIQLEGDNQLDKIGIRVPESSSLALGGRGNLRVEAQEIQCYGIGNSCNVGVGEIRWASSGNLILRAEGNECVALGGGVYRQGKGVQIVRGTVEVHMASEKGIGIGCYTGALPVEIRDCRLKLDYNAGIGLGIGCLEGDQNIHIANSSVDIMGSGSRLCGIGSVEQTGGMIHIESGKVAVKLNGQNVGLVGNAGGSLTVLTQECRLELKSEGSRVWGVGSMDKSATIRSRNSTYEINIRAGENVPVGAEEENTVFDGGDLRLKINED